MFATVEPDLPQHAPARPVVVDSVGLGRPGYLIVFSRRAERRLRRTGRGNRELLVPDVGVAGDAAVGIGHRVQAIVGV